MSNPEKPLLQMRHITKTYQHVVANNDVSIDLYEGEILAIVGENGAGKTTLMKVLYGLEKPDSGEVFLKGERVVFNKPSDAMEAGIGMLQQNFMLFGPMTVAENIVYQNEPRRGVFFDEKKTHELVKSLSQKYNLNVNPTDIIDQCPVGVQQRVEIIKILYQNANIIIFDEPTAVLTPLEVEELLKTLKYLSQMGKTIILITHKLREVMTVSNRVVVMRDGSVVAVSRTKETSISELSFEMVNRQIKTRQIRTKSAGNPILEIRDLELVDDSGAHVLRGINLHVNSSEIVGIAGVAGNGQSDLVKCITGLQNYDSGEIYIEGENFSHASVGQIREGGLSHIPEDRILWGSAIEATLTENILMGSEGKAPFSKNGFLDLKVSQKYVAELIARFEIKAGSVKQKIKELSGGNAQKLIVAREISKNSKVIVACEPTRGVDIGAMEFVHDRLLEVRDNGGGVLLVSSELSEIIALSDRIYVIFEGRINGEFTRGKVDEKTLGLLMLGGSFNVN
jgi:general nucleoside transport system ATP-binding protein